MKQKLEELKTHLNKKFQAQNNSVFKTANDICSSRLKSFDVLLNKGKGKLKKSNGKIERLESEEEVCFRGI